MFWHLVGKKNYIIQMDIRFCNFVSFRNLSDGLRVYRDSDSFGRLDGDSFGRNINTYLALS
jgi:hypothetical protein